jgi:hypothetical protein
MSQLRLMMPGERSLLMMLGERSLLMMLASEAG